MTSKAELDQHLRRFAKTPADFAMIARSRVDFARREWRILQSLVEQALDSYQQRTGLTPDKAVPEWRVAEARPIIRLQLMLNMMDVGFRNLDTMAEELENIFTARGTGK